MGSISTEEREARRELAQCRTKDQRRKALKHLAEARGEVVNRWPERTYTRPHGGYFRRW